MIFVLDAGNTNIVLGVFSPDSITPIKSWRIGTDRRKTVDEYEVIVQNFLFQEDISLPDIKGAVLASVVPSLSGVFKSMCVRMFNTDPLIVGYDIKTGMPLSVENPKEVGADRIANGVAAFELYGGPVIVADFGTATTFDVISEQGEYLGGTIAPGVEISMEALFYRAAKLPRVELKKPDKFIGSNTACSMQSGLMCSVIGGIEYTVEAVKRELGPASVVATGGLAEMLGRQTEAVDIINTDLTLIGLKIIYDRNR